MNQPITLLFSATHCAVNTHTKAMVSLHPPLFIQHTDNTLLFLCSLHISKGTCLLATTIVTLCFFFPALFAAWQVYNPASFSSMLVKMSSFASWRIHPVVGISTPFLSHQTRGSGTPRGATQATRCSLWAMKVFWVDGNISSISGENTNCTVYNRAVWKVLGNRLREETT